MTWELFYLTCFGFGLVMSVVSLLGGGVHHYLHFGHWHFGFHHGHAHAGSHGVSFLNGFTLTAFLCWFGGAGFLLERYGRLIAPLILGLALLTGLAGASLIFLFLAKVLAPHDRALTTEDTEMTGVIARVSGTIMPGGTGEILFSQNGARRASPARSETGDTVARDTEVVVMRYERGIAYVRRWDELSDGQA
jgi:membrane protein implicated in regulation of membrane protease activity